MSEDHYPYGREVVMMMPVREHLKMHLLATLGIPPNWLWWCEMVLDFEEEERQRKEE